MNANIKIKKHKKNKKKKTQHNKKENITKTITKKKRTQSYAFFSCAKPVKGL